MNALDLNLKREVKSDEKIKLHTDDNYNFFVFSLPKCFCKCKF